MSDSELQMKQLQMAPVLFMKLSTMMQTVETEKFARLGRVHLFELLTQCTFCPNNSNKYNIKCARLGRSAFVRMVETDTLYSSSEWFKQIQCILAGSIKCARLGSSAFVRMVETNTLYISSEWF